MVLMASPAAQQDDSVDVHIRFLGVATSSFRPHANGLLPLIFFRLSFEIGYLLLNRCELKWRGTKWPRTFVKGVPTIRYPSLPLQTVSLNQNSLHQSLPEENKAALLPKDRESIVSGAGQFVGTARSLTASIPVRVLSSSC